MKRLPTRTAIAYTFSIMLLLALLYAVLYTAHASTTTTPVCGTITTTTTWTVAGSPYILCASPAVNVSQGVTLTIQPGVIVQSAGPNGGLSVNGTLIATGTPTQAITFTRQFTTTSQWLGIQLNGSATASNRSVLDYVSIDHAGLGSGHGAIELRYTDAIIKHTLVRDGNGHGIYVDTHGLANISDVSLQNNNGYAIWFNDGTVNPTFSRLSAAGNTSGNVVALNGFTTLSGSHVWEFTGLPYLVLRGVGVAAGSSLEIEPGVQVQFEANQVLQVFGQLIAAGTPDRPITFTGVVPTPGYWHGLEIDGAPALPGVAQIDYATIEYGGFGAATNADISVNYGQVSVKHSLIQHSLHDGIYIGGNTLGDSIFASQIIDNAGYGILNTVPARPIMATNNWWGDPNGPSSDAGCGTGTGSHVSTGVIFRPVLTATNAILPVVPLSDATIVTLTPERWFAPADGSTRVYLDLALRDGNGNPIPNRTINVVSSLGTVVNTGVTDPNGRTLAYLTSPTVGDANVYANLQTADNCEDATSPVSKITFTAPVSGTDLMPDSQAPYVNADLEISPEPVVRGVVTTISATLKNASTAPITVDVDFNFAQASIGLAFGPLGSVTNQVIPPGGSITLSRDWVPVVSGHYCIQVRYTIVGVGSLQAGEQPNLPPLQNFKQKNVNVGGGGLKDAGDQATMDKTRNSLKAVNTFVDKAYDTRHLFLPLEIANQGIEWILNTAEKAMNGLWGDPPTQDYTLIAVPHKRSLPPVVAGNGVSQQRADAMNAFADALLTMDSYAEAAATANDRYAGASTAQDLQWASLQTSALLEYRTLMAGWAITTSIKLDDLIAQAASEGATSVPISADQVRAFQTKLATQGFTATQINDAHAVGLTDDEIEAIRQDIIHAEPNLLAGDFIADMQQLSADLWQMGHVLLHPQVFSPSFTVGGSSGLAAGQAITPTGNTMAQVFNSTSTFLLSNPLTQTQAIDLLPRRIDLPADWMIHVSPSQVTLDPGQTVTVTVTIMPGSAVPQGSLPQIAVEGYVGSTLLGGVAIDAVVPYYKAGFLQAFLPLIER
jgi:hypothetical protein